MEFKTKSKTGSTTILNRVAIAVMKHHNIKQLREERLILPYPSSNDVKQELKWDGDLEAGTGAEAVEESCLFAWAS